MILRTMYCDACTIEIKRGDTYFRLGMFYDPDVPKVFYDACCPECAYRLFEKYRAAHEDRKLIHMNMDTSEVI